MYTFNDDAALISILIFNLEIINFVYWLRLTLQLAVLTFLKLDTLLTTIYHNAQKITFTVLVEQLVLAKKALQLTLSQTVKKDFGKQLSAL